MTTATKTAQAEARDYLLEMVKPGTTVYTDLRHVSASGTTRWMDVFIVDGERIRNITSLVCKAAACGLLERQLLTPFATDSQTPVEATRSSINGSEPSEARFGTRNGEPDSNGGYALKHSWL